MSAGDPKAQPPPLVADSAPRVYLIADAGTEKEKKIACRRVVTFVGSRPGCKLMLRHGNISPVHLAIVNTGTDVYAADLVTTHGSLLNDLKMQHERLSDGDRIKLGTWEFLVRIEDQPYDRQNGKGDIHTFGLDPAPRGIALEHVASGRILQPTRQLCVIGRRHGCDIAISDNGISRVHALLFDCFGHPAVADLLSSNSTLVNDSPVSYHLLQDEDVITVGDSSFRVRMLDAVNTNGLSTKRQDSAQSPAQPAKTPSKMPVDDMIDIQATERAQRWAIVDNLEKATRKT